MPVTEKEMMIEFFQDSAVDPKAGGHSSGTFVGLKDGHPEPFSGKFQCCCQTCETGSDYGHMGCGS
jgi:hypothetical protein